MGAISTIKVDTDRLQRDIDSLRSNLSGLQSKGEEMMASVEALNGMWEGDAKEALLQQFKADYKTLESMEKVIEKLIKQLEKAKQQYDSCENRVGEYIDMIRV